MANASLLDWNTGSASTRPYRLPRRRFLRPEQLELSLTAERFFEQGHS